MAKLPNWVSVLVQELGSGCASSALIAALDDDLLVLPTAKKVCLDLWPFIEELPNNIVCVRDAHSRQYCPSDKSAGSQLAQKLLAQLSDDERFHQQRFLQQCKLAGIKESELNVHKASPSAKALRQTISRYCQGVSVQDGIVAIVTAELAATAFARASRPKFERYFEKFGYEYEPPFMEEGLQWLRFHSENHTRQALWLSRMLRELPIVAENAIPAPVTELIPILKSLWQCQPDIPLSNTSMSSIGEAAVLNGMAVGISV